MLSETSWRGLGDIMSYTSRGGTEFDVDQSDRELFGLENCEPFDYVPSFTYEWPIASTSYSSLSNSSSFERLKIKALAGE